jgi:PTH1 family peptidyl-tRNA hydrolase
VKLIVGLGNPGREYAHTRHNVGWWVLDHLADVWRLEPWRRNGDALVTDLGRGNTRVRLAKPQTYMNLSGSMLRPYLRREGWSASSDLLVVVDEVALPLGAFRLRAAGSAGGHNGLKSIEAALGTREYARLRIGIQPDRVVGDLADFVLDRFSAAERDVVRTLLPTLEEVVETWLREGAIAAMNRFNRRAPPKDQA